MSNPRFARWLALPLLLLSGFLAAARPARAGSEQAVAYQINPAHTGSIATAGPTPPLAQLWSVDLGGSISYPLIAGGKVYVTVAVTDSFGPLGTNLYALDETTGAIDWGPIFIASTYAWSNACYENGAVYVVTSDGLINAYTASSGALIWSERLIAPYYTFSSPPTALNGTVYVAGAASGGTVYAVRESDGALLWTAGVESGMNSSPVVTNDGVYVSYLCDIYKFDPSDGALLWQYSPACDGGGGKTAVLDSGRLYCRDPISSPTTGLILDSSSAANLGSFSAGPAPAFDSGIGFLVDNGAIHADMNGVGPDLWVQTNGYVTAPLVLHGYVFVGRSGGNLDVLNESDGSLAWSGNVGATIAAPDEQNASQPLTGLGAGEGVLVVPASTRLVAYEGVPLAPGDLAAAPGNARVDLTWTPSWTASTYNVKRAAASGGPYSVIATGVTGPGFTDVSVTNGVTYYYVVSAVNAVGESPDSAPAAAEPANVSITSFSPTSGVPGTAVDIYGSGFTGASAVTFNGTPSPNYLVYTDSHIGATAPAGASTGPIGVTSSIGTVYSSGNFIVLQPPTGLSAAPGDTRVTLSWNAAAGATNYNVKRSTTGGGPYTTLASPTGTTFTDTGLTNGTTYYYVVSSVSSGGESANTAPVSATPVLEPPLPPGNVNATPENGTVLLAWPPVSGATAYNVKRSVTSGGPYATIAFGYTSINYYDNSVTNGTTYYYVVSSINAAGEGSNSPEAKATPFAPPTLLNATAGNAEVTLTWNASAGDSFYSVKRSATNGGPYTTIVTNWTTTSFTDTGLTNGTTYYYVVSASDSENFESANSSQASATPLAPPPAPTGLTATPGDTTVALKWNGITGGLYTGVGTYVQRATTSGGPYITIAFTGATTYTDTGLTNGTTYYYVVYSVNAGGNSPDSSEVSATPLAPVAAPTKLVATGNRRSVSLQWTASITPGVTQNKIYRAGSSGGPYTLLATIAAATTYTDSRLSNRTTYYYVVTAVLKDGTESPYSNQASAKTK